MTPLALVGLLLAADPKLPPLDAKDLKPVGDATGAPLFEAFKHAY